ASGHAERLSGDALLTKSAMNCRRAFASTIPPCRWRQAIRPIHAHWLRGDLIAPASKTIFLFRELTPWWPWVGSEHAWGHDGDILAPLQPVFRMSVIGAYHVLRG
ncbi:hypothetical protein GGI1_16928, partial [Acidithiobacillus sp. GGI-221]